MGFVVEMLVLRCFFAAADTFFGFFVVAVFVFFFFFVVVDDDDVDVESSFDRVDDTVDDDTFSSSSSSSSLGAATSLTVFVFFFAGGNVVSFADDRFFLPLLLFLLFFFLLTLGIGSSEGSKSTPATNSICRRNFRTTPANAGDVRSPISKSDRTRLRIFAMAPLSLVLATVAPPRIDNNDVDADNVSVDDESAMEGGIFAVRRDVVRGANDDGVVFALASNDTADALVVLPHDDAVALVVEPKACHKNNTDKSRNVPVIVFRDVAVVVILFVVVVVVVVVVAVVVVVVM